LRARVAKRDAGAYDGFRVVVANELNDDITLLPAQLGAFLGRWAVGEVRHWRARQQDRIDRREDAALAQGPDDPSHVARGEEVLRGLDEEHATVEDVRIEGEPPGGEDPFDDLQAAAPGAPGD
jgi:hypothetical protein